MGVPEHAGEKFRLYFKLFFGRHWKIQTSGEINWITSLKIESGCRERDWVGSSMKGKKSEDSLVQWRDKGGLGNGDGEKWMVSSYILKVELTGLADYGWDMRDQGNLGVMIDSAVSGFSNWVNG